MPNVKRVYTFGNKQAEGNGKMRELLGGKGANLAEMNLVGIPVPPGFTITTEVCTEYYQHGKEEIIKMIKPEVEAAMKGVEKNMGMEFGSSTNPLLLSVRSGARASMPGMMDTILNLGLNDEAVEGLAKKTGNARFAWDSYRRFVQMYGALTNITIWAGSLPTVSNRKERYVSMYSFPIIQNRLTTTKRWIGSR